jgi:hypothetical protein
MPAAPGPDEPEEPAFVVALVNCRMNRSNRLNGQEVELPVAFVGLLTADGSRRKHWLCVAPSLAARRVADPRSQKTCGRTGTVNEVALA